MRSITPTLLNEYQNPYEYILPSKLPPIFVDSFTELVKTIARIAYLHKDYLLFFRGQNHDYQNKGGASTYYPSIYRGEKVTKSELELRFDILHSASARLVDEFERSGIEGYRDVKRRKYIQWSILQHYEVCPTPLLDLSQSLRVACSFAFLSANEGEPYLGVFGLPYLTNRVSINSEHDIINIRLLSICPPEALRPYFQDGYVAGTDEITNIFESKTELDFNNRLIAKFCLRNKDGFWRDDFDKIPYDYLFPAEDKVLEICRSIKDDMGQGVQPGRLGQFLQVWTIIENSLMSTARNQKRRIFSIREAIGVLQTNPNISKQLISSLDQLRRFRNKIIHSPQKVGPEDVIENTNRAEELIRSLRNMDIFAS